MISFCRLGLGLGFGGDKFLWSVPDEVVGVVRSSLPVVMIDM